MPAPSSGFNPQLSFNQVIEDFLSLLMQEAGMDTASTEVRAQMLTDLRARLNDRLFATVILNLKDEALTKFRQLVDSQASGEELEKFIDAHIPDSKEVFSQAMMTFRNDYLGVTA